MEKLQESRLYQLEAEIGWPKAVGTEFAECIKESRLEESPLYIRIGAIMHEEGHVLRMKFSKDLFSHIGSPEDRILLSQLISGYLEITDIILEADLIEATNNQFEDYGMSALSQAEAHLKRDSILKLVKSDQTGVELLRRNRTMIETSEFPEAIKRGFARGYDRYMQILNYLQE